MSLNKKGDEQVIPPFSLEKFLLLKVRTWLEAVGNWLLVFGGWGEVPPALS